MVFIDKLEESKKKKYSWMKEDNETTRSIGKIVLFLIASSIIFGVVYFIIFLVRLYSGEKPIR